MKKLPWKYWLASTGLALGLQTAVSALPLNFAQTPARDAAAQISAKYGIGIVLRDAIRPDMPVTFSLPDGDADGARLQAVNALANALSADFQKTYVVSKADTDADVSVPKVDTNATIAFPSLTISAQDAVQRVAGVDSATAQISVSLTGTVTVTALSLDATQAAREIAQQTHTRWKVFFALTPRTQGRVLGGKVIGYTSSGSPIIEEPYTYYRATPVEAPPAQVATQANSNANSAGANPTDNGYGQMPYGFYSSPNNYPYGFDPYAGNNPYSQNIYAGGGYGMYGPATEGSGLVVGGGYGYDAPIVFGGSY